MARIESIAVLAAKGIDATNMRAAKESNSCTRGAAYRQKESEPIMRCQA